MAGWRGHAGGQGRVLAAVLLQHQAIPIGRGRGVLGRIVSLGFLVGILLGGRGMAGVWGVSSTLTNQPTIDKGAVSPKVTPPISIRGPYL